MKVKLAGYNVDVDLLEKALRGEPLSEDEKLALTPEVISASYARISRDPRPIRELRDDAKKEVAGARKTNMSIYYDMGHHSIAEHAVFNFDIEDISRKAVEDLEHGRLRSYTEKSQRYQKLKDDFIVPEELDAQDKKEFIELVNYQNEWYHKIFPVLASHFEKKFPKLDKKTAENKAKEDTRYVTSLAMAGQVGMTVNGRSLERMIRRFIFNPKAETRQLGWELYYKAVDKAPSLFFLCLEKNFYEYWHKRAEEVREKNPKEAARLMALKYENDYFEKMPSHLQKIVKQTFEQHPESDRTSIAALREDDVELVHYDPEADIKVAATLLFNQSQRDYVECFNLAYKLDEEGKLEDFFKETLRYVSKYDSFQREFEAIDFAFVFPISATGFAQLKRHRMMTLLKQYYNPDLGITVPDSFIETQLMGAIHEVAERSREKYEKAKIKYGIDVAEYYLIQAHNARVYVKFNARELGAISRLREDINAQWDIRNKIVKAAKLAKKVAPLTCMLLGGRHEVDDVRRSLYG